MKHTFIYMWKYNGERKSINVRIYGIYVLQIPQKWLCDSELQGSFLDFRIRKNIYKYDINIKLTKTEEHK